MELDRQVRRPKRPCRENWLSSPPGDRNELHAKIGEHFVEQAFFVWSEVAARLLLEHRDHVYNVAGCFQVDGYSTSHWILYQPQVHHRFNRKHIDEACKRSLRERVVFGGLGPAWTHVA